MDAAGLPHIAYLANFAADDLHYAHWTGSEWVDEVVVPDVWFNGGGYTSSSIALDHTGAPHIAFAGQDRVLRYASRVNGTWQNQVVAGANLASYASLEIGSDDRPQIAYADTFVDSTGIHGRLGYSTRHGSEWSTVIADDAVGAGQMTDLTLDAFDRPRVSYHGGSGTVKHASYDGTAWTTEYVEAGQVGYWSTSIALDSANQPHLTYYKSLGLYEGALRYATIVPEPSACAAVGLGVLVGLLIPPPLSRRAARADEKIAPGPNSRL